MYVAAQEPQPGRGAAVWEVSPTFAHHHWSDHPQRAGQTGTPTAPTSQHYPYMLVHLTFVALTVCYQIRVHR
jgi:hypothetical protein